MVLYMQKISAIILTLCLLTTTFAFISLGDKDNDDTNVKASISGTRATLIVGPGQIYINISSAISAANPGDTIRIYNGLYYEHVQINKSLTLIGNSTISTIINGSGIGKTLNITPNANNVTLKNLHIQDGGYGYHYPNIEAGLFIDSQDALIESCTFSLNTGYAIIDSGERTKIINCSIHDNLYGIYLYESTKAVLYNNDISYNHGNLIFGKSVYSSYIYKNKCNYSDINNGIEFSDWCFYNLISNNYFCHNGNVGIRMYTYSSAHANTNNYFYNNTCVDNKDRGIEICGFYSYNKFINNTIKSNSIGINIYDQPAHNDFCENNISFNMNYGVRITWGGGSPFQNNFYHNNFFFNSGQSSQAYVADYCPTNFSKGNSGNYWSSWTSPDSNNDGIVDSPYSIAGPMGETDDYPLAKPFGAPYLINVDVKTTFEDLLYNYSYKASDPSTFSQPLEWSFSTNAHWLNFTNKQELIGLPANEDVGSYWVHIKVSDGEFSDETNFTLTVKNVNDPPQIYTKYFNMSITEDVLFYKLFNATDIDPTNDIISWNVKTNATFLTMDPTNGNLSGTPDNADVGIFFVNVTASDGKSGFDFNNFTLSVINVNGAPVIETLGDMFVCNEDVSFSFPFNATDEEQAENTLDWELTPDVEFLTFNTTSFSLEGLPRNNDVGVYNVSLNVSDADGGFDVLDFELWVRNAPPEINTTDVISAYSNELYCVDYNCRDDGQGTITYSLHTNTGNWLAIDEDTGVLSGTPSDADTGDYWVNVNVSDGNGGYDETNFTLVVSSIAGPPFINISPPDITMLEDTVYYIDLDMWFIDPKNDALTFRCEGNSDITVDILTNGSARFTPKSDWSGTENLMFYANDSISEISDSIVITVTNVNDAPKGAQFTLPTEQWYGGESKTLIGNATDPDLVYGDMLTYTWYIDDVKAKVGNEAKLTLSSGNHIIKLIVSDKVGANTSKEDNVMVYSYDDIDDDTGDDDTFIGSAAFFGILIGAILLMIIIIIVVVLLMRRKKLKSEGKSATETKPEGDAAKMTEQTQKEDYNKLYGTKLQEVTLQGQTPILKAQQPVMENSEMKQPEQPLVIETQPNQNPIVEQAHSESPIQQTQTVQIEIPKTQENENKPA